MSKRIVDCLDPELITPRSDPRGSAARRALVVDDSAFHRAIVRRILESLGWEVVEAVDGADAVPILVRGGFGLVVCDLCMPRLDGSRVAWTAQKLLGQAMPPFVLMSSLGPHAVRRAADSVGVRYSTAKPFDHDAFVSIVEQAVGAAVVAA